MNLRRATGRAGVERFHLFCVGLLLTALFACLPAAATATSSAITRNAHGVTDVGVNVTASPISVSLTNVAAGDLIVCEVSLEQGVTLTSVSDPSNGVYSPAIAFHTNSTMTQQIGIYFVANAAAGSYSVSVAWTGGAQSYQAMACQSWTGAAISSPQDTTIAQQQDNSSTPNPTSGSTLTPASAGELVIGNLMTSTQIPTAGANYALTDSAPVTYLWPEYWVQTAAAATNSPYTNSSDNWTDQTVAFRPASSVAAAPAITRNAHGVTDVGVNVTASPISVSLTNVAAGDLIVCEVSLEQGATLTSVSDPSNGTYSPAIAFHTNSTMTQQLGIYFVANAAAGSYSVSVAWTGGAQSYQAMACQSWTGAATSSPQDTTIAQQQDNSSTPNPTSGSTLAPASAGELVIGNLMTSTQIPTAGVNYALTDSAPVTYLWPEYWVQTAAAATNSPYTNSSDNWTDQIVAFRPASSSAAAPAAPATAPALSINATTIAFGDVVLNNPATQSVTLTSSGTASVTVSAATVAGTGFTVSGTSFPLTLSPNQTATLSVEFNPAAAGTASGSLTLTSNSSTGSSTVIAFTGTGETASSSNQVNVTWDPPTTSSDPVAGYNVYRSPSGNSSYQQLNASAITQTSYVDTTAQDGQSYDYIVESVDAFGVTSTSSNMASATTQ